jgi:hypothetical protein
MTSSDPYLKGRISVIQELSVSDSCVRKVKHSVLYGMVRSMSSKESMGDRRGIYRILVGKPEGKRPLGRSRHRWKDNIKLDLQEVGCGGMDWIELAQDRDRW